MVYREALELLNSRLRIVLDPGNSGWILEKIAFQLSQHLTQLDFVCSIESTPSEDIDINLWIHYMDRTLLEVLKKPRTMTVKPKIALVTHVDDSLKLARVKFLIESGVHLIFMSPQHANEIQGALDLDKPFDFVLLPSDYAHASRKYRMGIVSKCYPDGRKNEKWLTEFARLGFLANVEISIVGYGWENTVKKLRALGIETNLYDGMENEYPAYTEIRKFYQYIDLYFYFGFDEGALGSLDAYIFKTDLLVSNQGFHSLFITNQDSLFRNFEDAKQKLKVKIAHFEKWSASVESWTWETFASDIAKHISVGSNSAVRGKKSLTRTNLNLFITNKTYRFKLKETLRRLLFVRFPRFVEKHIRRK